MTALVSGRSLPKPKAAPGWITDSLPRLNHSFLDNAIVSKVGPMAMQFEERLANRDQWHADPCSVAKALDLLNTKTVFLVLRECLYGTSRFEDFLTRIGSSAPAVSRALKQLESAQVVRRVPYREPGTRARDAYQLTPAGEDLLPVMLSLAQWGDTHLQGGSPPLTFVSAASGEPVRVRVTTDADSPGLGSDDIEVHATFVVGEGR